MIGLQSRTPILLLFLTIFLNLAGAVPYLHRSLSTRQDTAHCEEGEVPDCCELTRSTRRWAWPSPQLNEDFYEETAYVNGDGDTGLDGMLIAVKKHAADDCGQYMKPCCRPKVDPNEPLPDSSSEPEPLPNVPGKLRHGSS